MEPHDLPTPPPADAAALTSVLARHRRRRERLLGVAVVAALVGGLGLGWAFGNADGDDRSTTVTADDATAGPGTTVPAPAAMPGDGAAPELTLEPVRRRSVGDVDVRLYRQVSDQPACEPSTACPPPECTTETYIVEASNPAAAMSWWAGWAGHPGTGSAWLGSVQAFGHAEGDPMTVVLVEAGEGVATVRAGDDTAAVEDGIAVLIVPGSNQPEVTYEDADGAELGTAGLPTPLDCRPIPPALPPDTGEPPADRIAAEGAIRALVPTVFDNTAGGEQRDGLVHVVDGDELRDAQAEVRERYPEGSQETRAEVTEISFQGPDVASFRWNLTLNGSLFLDGAIGQAVLQDGEWKLTQEVWCSIIRRGGVACPG